MSSSPIRFASFTDDSGPNLPSSSDSGAGHEGGRLRRSPRRTPTSSQPPSSAASQQHLLDTQLSASSNSQTDHPFFSPTSSTRGTPRTPRSPGFLSTQGRLSVNHIRSLAHPSTPNDVPMDPAASERYIWGTNINVQESIHLFKDFLNNFTVYDLHRWQRAQELAIELHELVEADLNLTEDPRHLEPYYTGYLQALHAAASTTLYLDATHLLSYAPAARLYAQLRNYPHELISIMDLQATERYTELHGVQDVQITVRPFNLHEPRVPLRGLDPSDIDRLIAVQGLVVRTTAVLPDPKVGFFQCRVCMHSVEVEMDRGQVDEPTRCAHCSGLHTLQLVHQRCQFASKQVCKLQETPDALPEGQTPHTLALNLYDGLVDTMRPGDRVLVTGIYRCMPIRLHPGRRTIKPVFRTFLDVVHTMPLYAHKPQGHAMQDGFPMSSGTDLPSAVSATVMPPWVGDEAGDPALEDARLKQITEDEKAKMHAMAARPDLYAYLARSVAPSIFEMEDAKKGVLLQLFGGVSLAEPARRGDIHVLLVGDPGVAKSQLLQYVHQLAPRGVYTSGKGSSAVGLTASVVKDPDTRALVLESGALVLSDGGVCCIDEFDKMSDATRAVLHEVMEQQTISMAKAGIITTLKARTSLLASANPVHSKFDRKLTLVENIHLPPSLLSRFDLLFVLLDFPNELYDRPLAQHLVRLYMDRTASMSTTDASTAPSTDDVCAPAFLTKYIAYAKHVRPRLDDSSAAALVQHYVAMRSVGRLAGKKTVTATVRQLESMVRLSEAHARMRLAATVTVADVAEAARLIKEAMHQGATDPHTGRLDLDLLTTAVPSVRLRALRDAVEQALTRRGKVAVHVLIAELKKASSAAVHRDDVDAVLALLAREGSVHFDRKTQIVRKIGATGDAGELRGKEAGEDV